MIEKAREAAANYLEGLPNFFAKQVTTRYITENVRQGWNAQDVVSADVAYEEGHESYKNIRIDNKPTSKSMEDLPGTRSSGEFATLLIEVMDPGAQATFRRTGTDTVRGRSHILVQVRDHQGPFAVAGGISFLSSITPPTADPFGLTKRPRAFFGSKWMPARSHRCSHLTQSRPRRTTIMSGWNLNLSLLPVESEVLSCQRGTSICSRNKIEFRNYRKFGAESDITFDTTVK